MIFKQLLLLTFCTINVLYGQLPEISDVNNNEIISSILKHLNERNPLYFYKSGNILQSVLKNNILEVTSDVDLICKHPCIGGIVRCESIFHKGTEQQVWIETGTICTQQQPEYVEENKYLPTRQEEYKENHNNDVSKKEQEQELVQNPKIEPDNVNSNQNTFIEQLNEDQHETGKHINCLGCPLDIDTNAKGVNILVNAALRHVESERNQKHAVVKVLRLQQQVVAGIKYILLIELAPTVCQKNADASVCPLNEAEGSFICEVEYWERPWLGSSQIVKNNCTMSQHYTLQEPINTTKKPVNREIDSTFMSDLESQIIPDAEFDQRGELKQTQKSDLSNEINPLYANLDEPQVVLQKRKVKEISLQEEQQQVEQQQPDPDKHIVVRSKNSEIDSDSSSDDESSKTSTSNESSDHHKKHKHKSKRRDSDSDSDSDDDSDSDEYKRKHKKHKHCDDDSDSDSDESKRKPKRYNKHSEENCSDDDEDCASSSRKSGHHKRKNSSDESDSDSDSDSDSSSEEHKHKHKHKHHTKRSNLSEADAAVIREISELAAKLPHYDDYEVVGASKVVLDGTHYKLKMLLEKDRRIEECSVYVTLNEDDVRKSVVDKVRCDEHETKRSKRALVGGVTEASKDTPNVKAFLRDGLAHLDKSSLHENKYKVEEVLSVSTQVVSGTLWRIKAKVVVSDCKKGSEVELESCGVLDGSPTKICNFKIWDQPWIKNGKETNITCDDDDQRHFSFRQRRSILDDEGQFISDVFEHFLAKYDKKYSNKVEHQYRLKVFKENLKLIYLLNKYEQGTAIYSITEFADLTPIEFSSRHGLRTDLRNENDIPFQEAKIPDVDLPTEFDWRDKNAVTEVKDQGMCGSCWAFSVTGNVEGQYAIKYKKLLEFSEQELVDCDNLDQGCNGGLMENAYRSIEKLGGLESEKNYPYDGADEKCHFDNKKIAVQLSGALNISHNETDMAKWLTQNGPISIAINANAMQFYAGGVSHPLKVLCNPKNLDHGVLIVGYGVHTTSILKKTLPYWIVKNSWGKSWGEQGYYKVYRGDGTCGLNRDTTSSIVA